LAKSLYKAECWLTCLPAGNLHSLVWYVSTLHFPLSAFPLVTHHLCTSDGEGSPSPRQMGRAPHVRLRWGGLPIWAPDGECSLSDLQMGRAPYLIFRWGELPIRASDGESSLSGLQIGRALYLGCGWRVLPIRSADGERSLSHGSSDGTPPSFALTFYLFCLQSRGLKVVECVQSDDDAKDAAMLAEAMLQFLGGGPRSSEAPNPNNRLPPKLPQPPVPPNGGVEPM
jgi:hypothetical protein